MKVIRARWISIPLFALLACNNDKPKQSASSEPTAEAIPSDLVYNEGFDDKSLRAKAAPPGDAGTATTAETASGSSAKLIDPGADPKSPLLYAFSTKTRTVTATIKMAASQGAAAQDQPPFKFTFSATPKPKFGLQGAVTIDIKITKFEISLPPGAPAQAAASLDAAQKALVGVAGHFDATAHGDIDNLDFETEKLQPGADQIIGILQQALELLVVPVPNEPVGVGGKWTKTESKRNADQGTTMSTTVTITLLSRDQSTATLKVDAANKGSQVINDPRAPKGSSLDRSTKASYTVIIRFDGVSQKVDGEANNDVVQKVPGQPDQNVNLKITQNLTSQ